MSYRFDEKFAISNIAVCPVVSVVLELPVLQKVQKCKQGKGLMSRDYSQIIS